MPTNAAAFPGREGTACPLAAVATPDPCFSTLPRLANCSPELSVSPTTLGSSSVPSTFPANQSHEARRQEATEGGTTAATATTTGTIAGSSSISSNAEAAGDHPIDYVEVRLHGMFYRVPLSFVLQEHPGGAQAILQSHKRDITPVFHGHSEEAHRKMRMWILGCPFFEQSEYGELGAAAVGPSAAAAGGGDGGKRRSSAAAAAAAAVSPRADGRPRGFGSRIKAAVLNTFLSRFGRPPRVADSIRDGHPAGLMPSPPSQLAMRRRSTLRPPVGGGGAEEGEEGEIEWLSGGSHFDSGLPGGDSRESYFHHARYPSSYSSHGGTHSSFPFAHARSLSNSAQQQTPRDPGVKPESIPKTGGTLWELFGRQRRRRSSVFGGAAAGKRVNTGGGGHKATNMVARGEPVRSESLDVDLLLDWRDHLDILRAAVKSEGKKNLSSPHSKHDRLHATVTGMMVGGAFVMLAAVGWRQWKLRA